MRRQALAYRNFRLFLSGQVVSLTGRWMFLTAQDWLVVRLGGHGVALGTVLALQFLPTLLLGPWGGLLADRMDKRKVIITTQALFALLAAAQAVLVLTEVASIPSTCVVATLVGCLVAVDTPARQAFVVEMVSREHVTNASALNSVTFNTARIVGPALAGVLISAVGDALVFALTALSVVGVLQGLARMDSAALHRGAPLPRAKGQLREGLAYLRSRRDLLLVVSVMGVVSALGLNFPITLALMARQEFHGDARSYGLLSSALAVGSLVAAVVATRRKRPRQRTLLLGAFAFGISEVVAALMPTYLSFALSLVAVGAMVLTFTTTCNATVQLAAGEQVRGRVMSLYLMVFLGTTPIGAPIIGWVCQVWGPRVGLLVGGGGSALAAVLAGVWLVRREHAEGRTLLMPRLTWRDQEPVVPLVGSR